MQETILNLARLPSSKRSVPKLPQEPGVYIFFRKDTPIYIGKALNLKNRVSSYFSINLAPKTAKMISEAREIAFIKVVSELDSLLLEAKLVHDFAPQYNAALKDDKHPLYIRITKEKYPRILTARKIEVTEKNIAFYGPFPSSFAVRSVLRMLRPIFPYAEHKIASRACLYSHLGLCKPCPNEIEKGITGFAEKEGKEKVKERQKYLKNIRNIKRVLERKTDKVFKDLYRQMDLYSKVQDFERAAGARDQIKRLEYISQPILPTSGFLENPNLVEDLRTEELGQLKKILIENCKLQIVNLERIECFDVAHLAGASPTASMVTFIGGEPEKMYYRHFRIRQEKGMDDIASIREVAKRRAKHFKSWGIPDLIIVDGGRGQVTSFSIALHSTIPKTKIPVIGLAKRFETLVIPKNGRFLVFRLKDSPALHLVQRIRDEAHRFARRYHHKLLTKSLL